MRSEGRCALLTKQNRLIEQLIAIECPSHRQLLADSVEKAGSAAPAGQVSSCL